MKEIRIGTLVYGVHAERNLPQIIPHGFESFSLTFWQTTGSRDLSENHLKQCRGGSFIPNSK